jgi:hypothetical protein
MENTEQEDILQEDAQSNNRLNKWVRHSARAAALLFLGFLTLIIGIAKTAVQSLLFALKFTEFRQVWWYLLLAIIIILTLLVSALLLAGFARKSWNYKYGKTGMSDILQPLGKYFIVSICFMLLIISATLILRFLR